jgi:hypothetical protein
MTVLNEDSSFPTHAIKTSHGWGTNFMRNDVPPMRFVQEDKRWMELTAPL